MSRTMEPIRNKKNYESVTEQIVNMIKDGSFPEGSKLPSEAELAEAFQIGRSSIREAIKSLQMSGILVSSAGKGTFVAENGLASISYTKLGEMITDKDNIKYLVEARLMIEPPMAGLAAQHFCQNDIDEMNKCIQLMKACNEKKDILYYGHRFHRAVIHASGNHIMIGFHESISLQLLKMREMDFLTLDVYRRGIDEHQRILDAVSARDSESATRLMREHLLVDYSEYLE